MTFTRRQALQLGAAAAVAPAASLHAQTGANPKPGARPRVRLAVSTYSYWHFKTDKYPIEKVIEEAAALGFEGVEILHVQMADETPAYVHGLRKAAFRNGLSLPTPRSARSTWITPSIASSWPPSLGSPACGSTPAGGRPSPRSTTS